MQCYATAIPIATDEPCNGVGCTSHASDISSRGFNISPGHVTRECLRFVKVLKACMAARKQTHLRIEHDNEMKVQRDSNARPSTR